MRSKVFKRLFAALALITFLGAFYVGHFLLPQIMVKTGDPINKLRKLGAQYQNPNEAGLDFDSISIKSFDSLTLAAYYIPTTDSLAKATIIMLHGIRAYKEHFISISKMLVDSGYNVALLDNRAHGDSEGEYCTFGVKEKNDVAVLIDYLEKHYQATNIGVWGQSLGGAIAMQSLAADKRIKFGIIESTFSNCKEVAHDYINRFAPFLPRFYASYIIYRGAKMANFKLDDANPKDAAILVDQPIFLAHGVDDDRINIKYSKENLSSLKSKNVSYLPVEGANHVNVWQVGGSEYFKRVFEFLHLQEN